MKKIGFYFVILSMLFLILSGCSSDTGSLEGLKKSEDYTYYMDNYYVELGALDTSISTYHIDWKLSAENMYTTETFDKLEEIQKWLDNNNKTDIVGMMPFYEYKNMTGVDIIVKESQSEHRYKVVLTPSNPYLKTYKGSISIPDYHDVNNSSNDIKGGYVVIIEDVRDVGASALNEDSLKVDENSVNIEDSGSEVSDNSANVESHNSIDTENLNNMNE